MFHTGTGGGNSSAPVKGMFTTSTLSPRLSS